LITHKIPEEAIQRFINSKESFYNNDNVVQRYLNSLSPKTVIGNSRAILRFCWIIHMTPRELIEMAKKDKDDTEKMLDDAETYCLQSYENPTFDFNKTLPKNTAKFIAKAVKGFYKLNKLSMERVTLAKLMKLRTEKQRNFLPTKKDIRAFRDMASPRDRLLIEFNTNIPLRREEISESLTWKKLDLTKPYSMIIFHDFQLKGSGKGKFEGCLFLGIISESVRQKLIQRKKEEEERFRTMKEKYEALGYKFVSEFTEDTKVFLSSEVTINEETKEVSIEPLSYKAVGNMIQSIQKRSGIPLSLHKLRDYFQDQINSHCGEDANSVYANCFIAHKIAGTKRIYSHPEKQYQDVLRVWKKVEAYIDLDFDETQINIKLKDRARQLQSEGKGIDEILDTVLKERTQMLIQEVSSLKDSLLTEYKRSIKE
jgi:hypothetical protein